MTAWPDSRIRVHADIASKAAVKQFAKVLATELGPDAITVNTIQPGAMDTIGQRRCVACLRCLWTGCMHLAGICLLCRAADVRRLIADGAVWTYVRRAGLLNDEGAAAVGPRIPVGRMGTPADVGATAVFLASDEAEYVTGSVINVDGGWATSLDLPA